MQENSYGMRKHVA